MKKFYLKKIIVLIFIMFLSFDTFAVDMILPNGEEIFSNSGPGSEIELIVAGDSYAERFFNDEKDRDMKLFPYCKEGHTIEENWEILFAAFTARKKMIFLSISVNDRHRNTHPSIFGNELRNLFAIAKASEKKVFVHSYMYYDLGSAISSAYSPAEYDAVMRSLITEFKDTVYFIDMSDCVGKEYMLPDGVHYNKKFNDIMYDRILMMIDFIKGK